MPLEKITPKIISLYLGLIIIMITIVLFVEVVTLQANTLELSTIMRDTMERSCKFFSQESYILKSAPGLTNVRGNAYPILAEDGSTIASGLFYDSDSYKKILIDSPDAKELVKSCHDVIDNTPAARNNSYKILKSIINGEKDYLNYGITPTNLGFTYLDSETVSKIFKWKLTNRLTSSSIDKNDPQKRNNILYDNKSGQHYIKWNNFRIYLDGQTPPQVSKLTVSVLHLLNDRNEFTNDWKIFSSKTGLTEEYIRRSGITYDDIRSYRVLYEVRWKVDIGYEGILPIALVLNTLDLSNTHSSGDNKDLFRIDNDTKISVLSGGTNEEISRTTWDTSIVESPNYEDIGSLWSPTAKRNIGLAQACYYTIIH